MPLETGKTQAFGLCGLGNDKAEVYGSAKNVKL